MRSKINDIVIRKGIAQILPEDSKRRNFLKMAFLGAGALAVGVIAKKIDWTQASHHGISGKKVNTLGDGLLYSEDSKEFAFFDRSGAEILIFEK